MCIINWDLVIKLLGLIAVIIAAINFYYQKKMKRGEWLKSLFEKFYENGQYKQVRKWIDFGTLNDELEFGNDIDHTKEESFTDFLNFFEFIATLQKLRHLKIKEIEALFFYYLNKIKDSDKCIKYIDAYGFKNLSNLLHNSLNNEK